MAGVNLTGDAEIDQDVMAMLIEETSPEIVVELIDMFLSETVERRRRMQMHLAAGDLFNLSRDAHALVSSAAQFGGHGASDAALRLEQAARSGGGVEALLGDVEQHLAAFVAALVAYRHRLTA